MEESAAILLSKQWLEDEKKIIESVLLKLKQYKSFIPRQIKNDIKEIFDLANKIKSDYESLASKVDLNSEDQTSSSSSLTSDSSTMYDENDFM